MLAGRHCEASLFSLPPRQAGTEPA